MFTVGRGILSTSDFLLQVNNLLKEIRIVKNQRKIRYYNVPAAFDIETTSFYDNKQKRGIMYHWQFGIYNLVTTGRTWEEYDIFIKALKQIMQLDDELRLAVYVHNLPFEFQWMRRRFDWETVFLLDNRKPVYANNHGIEYRCSFKLSGGKSLENVGKDLQKYKVNKAKGDLDYRKIRTPLTSLTEKELYYCEMDIRVLESYIQEKIEQDGDITRIPMTNTGYVRAYCRKECHKDYKGYRALMNTMTIDAEEYYQLKQAFQGGFTHANARYVKKGILKDIGSYDLTSSYPAVMVLEQFPMSKSRLVDWNMTDEELMYYLTNKCCLFDIKMNGVVPKLFFEHPISASKCWEKSGWVEDNGRIVTADSISMTITEQDFFTYMEFYDMDTWEISNFRYYEKAYLPKNFIKAILGLYEKKTVLKGIESEFVNYMISKNMINASFGMSVTDIVRREYEYIEDTLLDDGVTMTDFPEKEKDVEGDIERYNKSKKRFLFYPWGVWITAYARANLFSAILSLKDDYVYSDTDSVKVAHPELHKEYFEKYNEQIMEKIQASHDFTKIPISKYAPKTRKGVVKPIGQWDDEGVYKRFKTLGAKRYITYKYDKDKEDWIQFDEDGINFKVENKFYTLTMAGANKKTAMHYLMLGGKPFEDFCEGLVIPTNQSGRLCITYIDYHTHGILVDYIGVPYEYDELTSIHMEEMEYSLKMDKFSKYLKGIEEVTE